MLMNVLQTETDPELRKAAIIGVAIEGEEGAADIMEQLYEQSDNWEEKTAILEALVVMDEATDLALKIVRTENEPGASKECDPDSRDHECHRGTGQFVRHNR